MCIFTMYDLVTITCIIYPCSCQNAPMCNTENHSYQLEDQRGYIEGSNTISTLLPRG